MCCGRVDKRIGFFLYSLKRVRQTANGGEGRYDRRTRGASNRFEPSRLKKKSFTRPAVLRHLKQLEVAVKNGY